MAGRGELVHLGCYTAESGGRGQGIVAARRDPASGVLTVLGTVAVTPSPSFLARHPARPVLYAVNEVTEGSVSAWRIGTDGDLTGLGSYATGGESPCHVAVAPDGGHLFVANYGSGSVAAYPLDGAGVPGERTDLVRHDDPDPGPDPSRQEGPHAHMVSPDPSDGTLLAVDLGTDAVFRYAVTGPGRLVPAGPPVRTRPGAGPRHLARHPDGRRWFLAGELDATVTAYEWAAEGAPELAGGEPARGLAGGGPARGWAAGGPARGWALEWARVPASGRAGHVQPSEIALGADGRYLYVANRGVGTLSTFALDAAGPRLVGEVATGGSWPRHFAVVGAHLYVADERADLVAGFVIDPATGVPSPMAGAGRVAVPSPTCVLA